MITDSRAQALLRYNLPICKSVVYLVLVSSHFADYTSP